MVHTPEEIISGAVSLREASVVVIGSGMTGLEVAEILSERARNNAVVVLEAADKIAPGALGSNRNVVTAVLEVNNAVIMLNRTVARIGEDRIFFSDTETGEAYTYPCDAVVLAVGVTSVRTYGGALEGLCDKALVAGDAEEGGNIWHAIHDGYHKAAEL